MKEYPLRESTVNRSQEDIQWEIARNKVIEKRRNDSSFFQICLNDRYKLIREDLRDYIDESVIEKENYEGKLSDNATILNRYFTSHENVCPYCEEDTEFLYEWDNEGRTCAECGREIESGGVDIYTDDEGHTLCESCFDALNAA